MRAPRGRGGRIGRAIAALLLSCCVASGGPSLDERFERARELYRSGAYAEAAAALEPLLPELRAETPPKRYALALLSLAGAARSLGRYTQALERADEAIAAAREAGERLVEAQALNLRGLAQINLGDYDEAVTAIRRSLDLHRRAGETRDEISRLSNLAAIAQMRNRYFQALALYEQAMERLDQAGEQEWSEAHRQFLFVNLASLYQRLGRYEKALDLYAAVAGAEGLSPSEKARMTANLGALYRRLGDPLKALEAYREAETLFVRERDVRGEISVLINRGIALALDLARLEEAEASFSEALGRARASGAEMQQVHALLYRGETRRRARQDDRAREDFRAALDSADRLGLVEEQWKALFGLGLLAEREGAAAPAESLYRDAVERIESLRARLEKGRLKREFLADKRQVYDALIELRLTSPEADPTCGNEAFCAELLDLIGRGRARLFRERLRDRRSAARSSTEAAAKLAGVRERLVEAWKRRIEASSEQRSAVERDIEALEREFAALEPEGGARLNLPPAMESLAEIRRRLGDDSCLLVFWTGPRTLVRFWADRDGAGFRLDAFGPSERARVERFIRAVSRPGSTDWRELSAALGERLLGGVPALGRDSLRYLIASPDPALHSVPLEALELPGARALAVERFAVSYIPYPGVPEGDRRPPPWTLAWSTTLGAFADPEPGSGSSLPRLAFARREVEAAAELLPGRARVRSGERARRNEFLAMLSPSPPLVVHLAAHALVDRERPELSRIVLAPADEGGPPDYLFVGEIEALDLRGVRLATLSACDSEQGKVVAGEGVEAMSRAFLASGAESVVAGLWRVADEPTAAFMEQFYYFLGRGETRAEALRLAMLRLREAAVTRHPYFWAAFRLTGRGRSAAVRPVGWTAVFATTAALLAALAGLISLRRRGTR